MFEEEGLAESWGLSMPGILSKENLQVMRCWLVASWGKPTEDMSIEEFKKFTLSIENQVLKLQDAQLEEEVKKSLAQEDHEKLNRLLTWHWEYREIFMKDFGPWRTVGDALPLEACKHSVVEAVEFIRNNPQGLPHYLRNRSSNKKYVECVAKLQSIARMAAFIHSRKLLSIIVAETNQRGREEGCDQRRYSSEEGSHRAIGLALAGYETVSAWVGNTPERGT